VQGLAEYIYIAHATEFLTLSPSTNSYNLLSRLSTVQDLITVAEGLSIQHATPKCCIKIQAYGVPDRAGASSAGPEEKHWIRDFFEGLFALFSHYLWRLILNVK